MARDSMVFYRSFMEALSFLEGDDYKKTMQAILRYAMDGEEPELKGVLASIFVLIKPQIDANNRRFENGTKGGRPQTKQKPKDNQNETKQKPKDNQNETIIEPNVNVNVNVNDNVNDNVNVNVNDNENDNEKENVNINDYIYIVDFLNQKANTSYKANTKKTQTLIKARLNEGFTIEDFEKVITKKADEWRGTEWEKYLRPETLFGTKFEGYLNGASRARNPDPYNSPSDLDGIID